MIVSVEFDNYIIYHEEEPGSDEKVKINCFMGDRTVGYLTFIEGEVPPPERLHTGAINAFFPYERFHEIITTLRYEKPLYMSIYGHKTVISTVHEPVGEQEGLPSPD